MPERVRKWMAFITAGSLGGLLVWSMTGLHAFGTFEGAYALLVNRIAVSQTHALNVVTAVVFDFRALDTLVEEFILFTAVLSVAVILRPEKEEEKEKADEDLPDREVPHTSDAVRIFGMLFVAILLLFGLSLTVHAHLSPGGGFQGGVMVASAFLTIYLVSNYDYFRSLTSISLLRILESVGVASYLLIGLWGILEGGQFLENVLPLGEAGALLSSGIIPLLSAAVGLAVGAGIVLLVHSFMEQTLIIRRNRTVRLKAKTSRST